MKSQQIFNLFYYTVFMLIDNQIYTTSPDYLREKTLKFFGTLGKPEFIKFPKAKYTSQSIFKVNYNFPDDNNFWKLYCKTWSVKEDDFELMNIINFLLNVYPIYIENHKSQTFSNFEKFIGNTELISVDDLSYMVHPVILKYLEENVDLNCRFLKLKALGN